MSNNFIVTPDVDNVNLTTQRVVTTAGALAATATVKLNKRGNMKTFSTIFTAGTSAGGFITMAAGTVPTQFLPTLSTAVSCPVAVKTGTSTAAMGLLTIASDGSVSISADLTGAAFASATIGVQASGVTAIYI